MKIRDERIDGFELVTRIDKEIRLTLSPTDAADTDRMVAAYLGT